MRILVLEGSPHVHGSSNTLADSLIKGAQEKGHFVEVVDVAHAGIHPCLGCDVCGMNGNCIQRDSGNAILGKILEANCLVFVTPVYYFGISAQLKAMIDRFYARSPAISARHLKVAYIAAAWNNDNTVMDAISRHFDILTDYLGLGEIGRVLAKGAGTPAMIQQSYLDKAYELGRSL